MGLKWISFTLLISAVCGVSAYVPYQYIFVNESKTWTEAQNYCRQTYTDLVTVNNMEEMKKLNAILKDKANDFVWIGLVRGDTGRWQWSLADGYEGEELLFGYQYWAGGEPNNAGGIEFCVAMKNHDGKWVDDYCYTKRAFVCYDEKNTTGSRYIAFETIMTWHEAQSYCRENLMDLTSVRNQTENDQILRLGTQFLPTVNYFWIGLFKDSWKWSDQSNSLFRYWASDQPDSLPAYENCAAVYMTEQDPMGHWYDVNCEEQFPFICRENKLILINQSLTWSEALRYCRENHVDLVSVHPEEIQLWVEEVVKKASTEHVWLGLRHTCTLGFWFWVSGESICDQNWAPGNGTGGEDCSSVERTGAVQSGGEQQWVSLPETQRLNFICTTYEG